MFRSPSIERLPDLTLLHYPLPAKLSGSNPRPYKCQMVAWGSYGTEAVDMKTQNDYLFAFYSFNQRSVPRNYSTAFNDGLESPFSQSTSTHYVQ